MSSYLLIALYLVPLLLLWAAIERRRAKKRDQLFSQGREEDILQKPPPMSLHPAIDREKCMGSGACVQACPEKTVLRVINGIATLVDPGSCIGHGACAAACPAGAITLVFGSRDRGIDIPALDPRFQTSMPGIYVAGELGGMGLIRNAIEQGRQAITAIAESCQSNPDMLDVLIVGAGPAGLSASLGAKERGLKFITIDQHAVGGTIAHYPRGKLVMTQAATLPLIGPFKFGEVSREELMRFWLDCIEKSGIHIQQHETMTGIERQQHGYTVTTHQGRYTAQNVLLCLGRRGSPRTLDAQGETLPKVVYHLTDPQQYTARRVLVVGGGDSAVEAACSIADAMPASIHLSYRRNAITGIKAKNQQRLQAALANGQLTLLLESHVQAIHADSVMLQVKDQTLALPNDDVLVCIGGTMPTQMLKEFGIRFDTKYGTA